MAVALPPPPPEFAAVVQEAPEWELLDGYFVVTCRKSGLRRAYPPQLFFQTFADMAELAHKWNFAGAEVIRFRPKAVPKAHR